MKERVIHSKSDFKYWKSKLDLGLGLGDLLVRAGGQDVVSDGGGVWQVVGVELVSGPSEEVDKDGVAIVVGDR